MSEFKGQLLGMLLVVLVFTGISSLVVNMFTKEVQSVETKFDSAISSSLSIRSY